MVDSGKRGETMAGPVNTDVPSVSLRAPRKPGTNYVVMAYVIAANCRASGFTVPLKVEKAKTSAAASNPIKGSNKFQRL